MDLPILAAALLTGGAGAGGGGIVARFSARRSFAQPLPVEPAGEKDLLGLVIYEPASYAKVATLGDNDFSLAAHRRIWAAIGDICGRPAQGADCLPEGSELPDAATLRADLAGRLESADLELVDLLAQHGGRDSHSGPVDEDHLLEVGGKILAAGSDRNERGGIGPTAFGGDSGDGSLVRVYAPPSRRRTLFTRAVLAGGSAAGWYMAPGHGAAQLLAGAALSMLVWFGTVISTVDIDTMYLDFASFFAGVGAAWAFAVAAALVAGDPHRLLAGVVVSVGVGMFFEVADLTYRAVRKTSGMGFGDTLIIFATVGVPAGLTGSVVIGVHAAFAGLVAGLIGAVAHMAVTSRSEHRFGRKTPFAFGPYLYCGWFIALGLAAIGGQL